MTGAGKTTMVRMLVTLSAPDEGRASVAGYDVMAQPNEVRRRIACLDDDALPAAGQRLDAVRGGREQLGGLHGLEVELLVGGLDSRKPEQPVDHSAQPLDLRGELMVEARALHGVGHARLQRLGERERSRDRRTQLVRHVGDQVNARAVRPATLCDRRV